MTKSLIFFQTKIQMGIVIAILFFNCQSIKIAENKSINKFQNYEENFENEIKKIYSRNGLKGDFIFAIVDENGLVYSYAYSAKELTQKRSVTNESPIYIASHTKSFTGTLFKILEDKGDLDLNKSIATYIPSLDFKGKIDISKITLTRLLTHTHGISNDLLTWKTAYLGYSGTNSELINNLNDYSVYKSLQDYKYSNIGPIVASMAIDEKIKTSWQKELSINIFQTLGMTNTSTKVSDYDTSLIIPSLITNGEGEIVDSSFNKKDITMHASGGIISTINDLSKWLSVNIRRDKKLMRKESWEHLHNSIVPQNRNFFSYHRIGYSLGWDIAKYYDNKILTRFGGIGGISFHISFMPEKRIGVIALSTDNRAYLLPHLMANYAYNTLESSSAMKRFNLENEIFKKDLELKSSIVYPKTRDLLKPSTANDKILGIYKTSADLPSLSINRKEHLYYLTLGVLDGKIYNNSENNYSSFLGPLKVDFRIANDSIFLNGLTYLKVTN